jgi:hypothetical protein
MPWRSDTPDVTANSLVQVATKLRPVSAVTLAVSALEEPNCSSKCRAQPRGAKPGPRAATTHPQAAFRRRRLASRRARREHETGARGAVGRWDSISTRAEDRARLALAVGASRGLVAGGSRYWPRNLWPAGKPAGSW